MFPVTCMIKEVLIIHYRLKHNELITDAHPVICYQAEKSFANLKILKSPKAPCGCAFLCMRWLCVPLSLYHVQAYLDVLSFKTRRNDKTKRLARAESFISRSFFSGSFEP